MKTAGMIGGLGPETTAEFYLQVIELCRQRDGIHYPPIVIFNIPFPYRLEQEIIEQNRNEEAILPFLVDGMKRLEQSGADFIVIPCNTVHFFIDELRACVSTEILSIIEEAGRECERQGYKRVGVLATTKTVTKKIYDKELERRGIEVITPTPDAQDDVARTIVQILRGEKSDEGKQRLLNVIDEMVSDGAETIVLGCTDLQLLVKQKDCPVALLDTLEIFAEATARKILGVGDTDPAEIN
jgi:aspartate racemase